MKYLEIFKDMYYHELEAKEKINSRINIPIGIATLLTSGAGIFLDKILKASNDYLKGIAIVFFSIYVLALIIMVINIFLAYYWYSYKYIPANYLIDFKLEVKEYYDENYEEYFSEYGDKNTLIETDFAEGLTQRYVEAAEWNMCLNEKKLRYLRLCGWMTLIALVSGSLTYIILIFKNIT